MLRGRLVDERGQGLVGWMIDVGAGGHGWDGPSIFRGQASGDAEGRFRILNCPDEPLWLWAFESRSAIVCPTVERGGLRAGAHELPVELPDAARASACIEARVVGGDERPRSVQVSLRRAGRERGHVQWSDELSGAVRFGPLAAGRFSISAIGAGNDSVQREVPELAAGETLDLGTLRLGEPGRIELSVAQREDLRPERVLLSIPTPQRVHVTTRHLSDSDGPIELAADSNLLEAHGAVLPETIQFSVVSDETTRLELAARVGLSVALHFQLPKGTALPLELGLAFHLDEGGEPWRTQAYLAHQEGLPPELATYENVLVPPASGYALEVSGPGGLRGSARIVGADLQAEPDGMRAPVVVVLR
ncbi:MAG: hypothetical protein IPK67_18830 [Planctomycetes bacterium]|nr:hypothetical protein [Planctomycetota bacterium]